MTSKLERDKCAFLNEFQVSERLGLAVQTLRRWRMFSQGPPWKKFSKAVRYSENELEGWILSRPGGGER